MSVIHRVDAHGVLKYDAIGCDSAAAIGDKPACDADAVELVIFFHGNTSAVDGHVVAPARLLQLGKVCYDRDLLTGE